MSHRRGPSGTGRDDVRQSAANRSGVPTAVVLNFVAVLVIVLLVRAAALQLLGGVAILKMLDRASLRAARAQLAMMLTLSVIADLLTVHTVYRIVIGDNGVLSLSETLAPPALLSSIAVGTGVSLVLIAVNGPQLRRIGWLQSRLHAKTATVARQ